MTLEERENDLFERWKKTLGDTDGVFAKDGVANEERFNSAKYKVLFLSDGIIQFFGEHDEFFSNQNLKKFYNNTIMKLDNHLVVNL